MNESLAFALSAIAACLGGFIGFLVLYRRKWRLWAAGLVLMGVAGLALYQLSGGPSDWALTLALLALFGIMPLAVGWVFGGIYGALRSRGKPSK